MIRYLWLGALIVVAIIVINAILRFTIGLIIGLLMAAGLVWLWMRARRTMGQKPKGTDDIYPLF